MKSGLLPVDMIKSIAVKLDYLRTDVAFLGGAVVALLITDPAARDPRPTQDVDAIIAVASKLDYDEVEAKLRNLGFSNDQEGPVCRFRHGPLILDVMPTAEEVLGFGNQWYAPALETATLTDLGDDVFVKVITASYFIATKLAAFESPGRENQGDYLSSRDFEDIVTVIEGRSEIVDDVFAADVSVRRYIAERLRAHLLSPLFEEGVSAHLDPDPASQGRAAIVLNRVRKIASAA
jgi:hypothetical protein